MDLLKYLFLKNSNTYYIYYKKDLKTTLYTIWDKKQKFSKINIYMKKQYKDTLYTIT
jgi:hypothetical protein